MKLIGGIMRFSLDQQNVLPLFTKIVYFGSSSPFKISTKLQVKLD